VDKVRLGGIALPNGVLVHGPRYWACAVRTPGGELVVGSGEKRIRSVDIESPLLRGPARLAEAFSLFPAVKRGLPAARLPFERPAVLGAMAVGMLATRALKRSRLGTLTREALSGFVALVPVVFAVRGTDLAAYHGAEHISIGTYEHEEPRTRVHERCGTHLVGPLVATTAVGNALAARAPRELRGLARVGAFVGATAAAVEMFGWMVRHPEHPAARALSLPGELLQSELVTAEPTAEQLEVADAAVAECVRLELEAVSPGVEEAAR
jgi:uncharacterized protein YqhQ